MNLQKYYAKWKKPATQDYILYDSIYMKFKNRWNQFMVVDVIKCWPGLGGGDSLKWKDYENVLCLILGGWLQNCQNLLNWTLNCAFYSM